jgi:histidyl-tRNA synthetase
MKFRSPRGTHDILPEQAGSFRKVIEVSRELFEHAGYSELVTPIFEENELFARSVGSETDIVQKEMYVFTDRGGRTVALRPEGTAPVVRSYIQHGLHARGDVQKLFYMGPMFRYDRPSAGRYRQFHQVGIEAIGSLSPYLDVECMALLSGMARRLGVKDVQIHLNSVGDKNCRPAYVGLLREYLAPRIAVMCHDCQKRYDLNPLRVLDCKQEKCRESLRGIPKISDHLCDECGNHFREVRGILDSSAIPYTLDPFLVRGLDYYTKTAFELIHTVLGTQASLGGGGRYDDLVELLGGDPTPAVGFSAGVERFVLALLGVEREDTPGGDRRDSVDAFFVATDETTRNLAFREMLRLREAAKVDMDFSGKSVKAQFRKADKLGARFAVVFGGQELARGVVKLKDLSSGEETEVPLPDLAERLGKTGGER